MLDNDKKQHQKTNEVRYITCVLSDFINIVSSDWEIYIKSHEAELVVF